MEERIKKLTEDQIKIIDKVISEIKTIEENEVIELAKNYFEDAKYFLKNKDYISAFEAIIISWAYIDACLHFGKIKIDESLKKYFTI